MSNIKRLCVFCGSSSGSEPIYIQAAVEIGWLLAEHDIELVYGGGRIGLMGCLADAVLTAGGKVIGVIPKALVAREVAHTGLTELLIVESMHERKAKMEQLSDGFIALPGGFGTIDEFFEILTWSQIGIHQKPCALLNVDSYFDCIIAFIDNAVKQKFILPAHRDMIIAVSEPIELLRTILNYEHQTPTKWAIDLVP